MSTFINNSRRRVLAAISAVITSSLVMGLASPTLATSWSDYAIPETGIVIMQTGNKGFALTPACQPRLLVTRADGSQGSHTLETRSQFFSAIGLTGCYTPLGDVQSSDTLSWWTPTATTPAAEMPIIEVTNMKVTPGNKTINLSWDVSNNPEWIQRYWFYFESKTSGGMYSKEVDGNNFSTTLNVVSNSDEWTVTMVPILKLNARAAELRFKAVANVIPLAPAGVTIQPGDRSLSVFFEPAANEPARIANYVVRVSPGDVEFTTTNKSLVITSGIQNNVEYQVSVRAVNAVGAGDWTDSNRVTTRSAPKLATNIAATAVGDRGARVSWTAATGDVTGYRVTSVTTGEVKVVSGRETSAVFTDVVGNRPRSAINSFTVATLNDYLSTVPSAIMTTAFLPDRAVAVSTSGAKNTLEVNWSAPADIETPIVKYTVELIGANNNVVATMESVNPSVSFENLTSGDRFRARVYVHTAWGRSLASLQSNQSTVQGTPSAPINALVRQVVNAQPAISVQLGSVSANGCSVSSWNAVATWVDSNGLANSRELSSNDPGAALTFAQVALGIEHTIAVTATNCWGQGVAATFTITPVALPEPVTNVKLALSASGDLVATWSPSVNKDVTSVLVTLNPGNVSYRVSASTSKVIFSQVALGQKYQVSLTARNGAGNSQTVTSAEFLAAMKPGQVQDLSVVVNEESAVAQISWNAPEFTGATISGYRIWVDGLAPQDITETSVDIEGLVAGVSYTFTIAAISDLGIGQTATREFGLASDPVVEESEPGVVVIWSMPKSMKSVKNVVVQKKVGKKWKTVATVKAKAGKHSIAKSKKTDVYRVKAVVSKKKQVSLKIKVVRK
jgi:hypothetical protein